jgi:hypothetical protein
LAKCFLLSEKHQGIIALVFERLAKIIPQKVFWLSLAAQLEGRKRH